MRLAIAVHGRFNAFDLAGGLLELGHEVTVLTNYPARVAARFGLPRDRVRSLVSHGVLSRASWLLYQRLGLPYAERWLHPMFGRWVARQIDARDWDAVITWSGVSEEVLRTRRGPAHAIVMRGSAHIAEQARLLADEEARAGAPLDRPTEWIVEREEREYALAGRILVLSTFAWRSFVERGVPPGRLLLVLQGADTHGFVAGRDVVDERCRRIESGGPLRVLHVGALSYQKGLLDLAEALRLSSDRAFEYRFVGQVTPEAQRLARSFPAGSLVGHRPQSELPSWYAWGDVLVLPTIQDGGPVVLNQAIAAALPILVTTNSAGPDLVRDGGTGWVLPIRSPEAVAGRLAWCDENRPALAEMVRRQATAPVRSWREAAHDLAATIAPAGASP